jgi:hypothetical protein
MFLFWDYTKFEFELVNQKMFEMKILKMTNLIYLVIFHLKMIIYQNVNLPHICGHHPKTPICDMIIIKLVTWLTNLFQSYAITMFNRYYKFHKD